MSDLEVVGISLLAVFVGLAILSFIIGLFPVLIRTKKTQTVAAPATTAPAAGAVQEDEEEMAAIIAAVSQAFEDEQCNPLVRNSEGL